MCIIIARWCEKCMRTTHSRTEWAKEQDQQIRMATINIGTLRSQNLKLADVLENQNVYIACIQETMWTGSRATDIGEEFKLIWQRKITHGSGVAIAVS